MGTERAAQHHTGKEIGRRHADAGGGGGQLMLGRVDVGPTPQKLYGETRWYARWKRRKRAWSRQFLGEVFWKPTEQNRDDVSACGDLPLDRRDIRLQGRQMPLRQGDVHFVGEPSLEARLGKIETTLGYVDILSQDGELPLKGAHVEIGARDVRGDCYNNPVARVGEGFSVVSHRFELALELAEDVQLPGSVKSARFLKLAIICAVFRRPERGWYTAARQIRSRANAAAAGPAGRRKGRADNYKLRRSRLLQPGQGDFDVEV